MLRNDYPVPRGRLLNKVMMNGQWLDPDDIRELVQKNQLWANLGFGQEGYNARGVGPGEGDHVVAEATGTLARTRDRLGLDAVPLQRSNDNWNDERDARHQSRLDDIERRTRYQDELTNIYLDRERHRLARMQKDDDEWTDTFNAMRDRIRHRSNSQFGRENDPRLSVAETQERKVDAKGRTQQQWIQAVKAKFPDAKIIQAKMIDGPSHALLSDGRKIVWNPVQDVAETGASFRAGNARRAAVNAMSPEERRAYDEKRAEQQRKRDEARMERERQRNAAKKDVAEGFDRLDSFTRKVLNRMEDDSWLSAERAYFIQKGAQEKAQRNREQYNQEIQRFIDLYKQYKGQLGVAEGSNKLQGTPVVSLSDFGDKDNTKDKYGRTVPKKLKKDDPRVKFNKEPKQKGVAEGATPASTSKVLRLIQRHKPEWFDNYGMGEVEDTVVDLADMGKFQGMSAVDALALVGQELESMYGHQGVAEGRFVTPKEKKPPKSSATASLKQLEKNKRENPGQSPFKTQDQKVDKYLGQEIGRAHV